MDYTSATRPAPLSWSEQFFQGAWVLSDYVDVAAALRDPRYSVQRAARWVNSSRAPANTSVEEIAAGKDKLRIFKRILSRSLLFIDGASHTRLRRIMQAGFSAAALQQQSPRVARIVNDLIQGILAKAQCTEASGCVAVSFDFIRDFARPLPVLVIADMLGIDTNANADFVLAAGAIADFIGTPTPTWAQSQAAQRALLQMFDFFVDVIAQRRLDLDTDNDDLIGLLMRAERNGSLSAIELLAQCCTLLFAGYETTRHLLGNGLLALLQHPLQWQALQAAPQRLPAALRELLRYDSPVQYTGRRLKADILLHGQQLRKGELVILHLAAANRDPQRFSNPGQLDIGRDEGNHLSFGAGLHVCLGATLTYMEAELAFAALLRAMPDLTLVNDGPRWQSNAAYHGLETLPLTCQLENTTLIETAHG